MKKVIGSSNTLGKDERLKSRKLISQLFREGKAVTLFPLRVLFLIGADTQTPLQAGFSVSSRNFKKATDRNRIKRLLRECYRTQKQPLGAFATERNCNLSLFFIYTGKDLPDYTLMKDKTAAVMLLLLRKITQTGQ